MLRSNKIDIMNMANVLQFNIPLRQLFGRQVESIPLMSNVMILAKRASKITPGEEDRATPIVTLYTRLYCLY